MFNVMNVRNFFIVDSVMMKKNITTSKIKLKHMKSIDLRLRMLNVYFAMKFNLFQINVSNVKNNLQDIIVIYVNFMMMILKKRVTTIVLNAVFAE